MNIHRIGIVYLTLVSVCWGYIGGHSPQEDVSPRIYCGRVLARAIAKLCDADQGFQKKSEGTMYNAILSPHYKEEEGGDDNQVDWWMPPHKAMILGITSKNKRFIVNECCDKPCRVSELLTYC